MPGWVTSRTDGDQHYIGEGDLTRLYGVSPAECVSAERPHELRGLDTEILIQLRPRYDGNYARPTPTESEEGT